jgi:hypothetical protein
VPDINLALPVPHPGQAAIWERRGRYNAVRCGRRWGKTICLDTIASMYALQGKRAGIFIPTYDQMGEIWTKLLDVLNPVISGKNKSDKEINLITGGRIDFWTLQDNELAGRGYEYEVVLIDEAAFTKNGQMWSTWEKAIEPTLLVPRGDAWVFSTPKGIDPDNFFYQVCEDEDKSRRFVQHYAPSSSNPLILPEELEEKRKSVHPLVWKQEYLAQFVDWSSAAFFAIDKLLVLGQPIPWPDKCDYVFAVMDCAVKSGSENDGTAITYFAVNRYYGHKLIILDWEVHSIDAAMLEHLTPSVLYRLQELAANCGARMGSAGMAVEDAAGGSVLIQQGKSRGWPITAISSKLTGKGKDERAMLAGGSVYNGDVKFSRPAHEKVCQWKEKTQNHLLTQILGFRVGDKNAHKRADDLLDTFTYGVIISLVDEKAIS